MMGGETTETIDVTDLRDSQNQYNRRNSDFADALRFQLFGAEAVIDGKEEDINRYVTKDKKRDGDKIDIVYLEDYEKFSFIKLSYEELKEYVKHVR